MIEMWEIRKGFSAVLPRLLNLLEYYGRFCPALNKTLSLSHKLRPPKLNIVHSLLFANPHMYNHLLASSVSVNHRWLDKKVSTPYGVEEVTRSPRLLRCIFQRRQNKTQTPLWRARE